MNADALVPILNSILTSDDDVFTDIGPRRVDFEGGAEYSNSGDLIRRSANGTQATFAYDSLDRLAGITLVNIGGDPSESLSLVFTYINSLDERLRRVQATSSAALGIELNTEVNFEYSTTEQFSSETNGSFQVPAFVNNQVVIVTVNVAYEPVYIGNTLVRINTRLTDDLGSPAINNVMNISYEGGVISEVVLESSATDAVRTSRRENLSLFQQQVDVELIGSDGDVNSIRSDVVSYEEIECSDSNRSVEENLSTLSLFYPVVPDTFFLPEICRD